MDIFKRFFLSKEKRQKLKKYKQELLRKDIEKAFLLTREADWGLLEKLIQECNTNPQLRVDITLLDGTTLRMKTYQANKKADFQLIDGNDYGSDIEII